MELESFNAFFPGMTINEHTVVIEQGKGIGGERFTYSHFF